MTDENYSTCLKLILMQNKPFISCTGKKNDYLALLNTNSGTLFIQIITFNAINLIV